jgi:hypothetical protein
MALRNLKLPLPRHPSDWTRERIDKLDRQEVEQLRSNAAGLGEEGVVALCTEALQSRPKTNRGSASAKNPKVKRLISRGKAFEARGVFVQDPRTSWGGVRKSDGAVVLTLWSDDVVSRDGGCSYLLWAPNVGGARPWSDTPSGQERLKHCQLVMDGAAGEALLVVGERLQGHIPEDKARSVHGVDPETVVHFKVVKHGEEYWAVWGKSPH